MHGPTTGSSSSAWLASAMTSFGRSQRSLIARASIGGRPSTGFSSWPAREQWRAASTNSRLASSVSPLASDRMLEHERFRGIAFFEQQARQMVQRRRELRLDRERALVFGFRFVGLSQPHEHVGKIGMPLGDLRRETDGLAIGVGRLAEFLERDERSGEVEIGRGIVAVQRHGAAVVNGRLLEVGERVMGRAQIVVIAGIIALELDRLADQHDRVLVTALVMGDDAEIVQRLRIVRLDGERLLVKCRGLGKSPRLMLRDGLRQEIRGGAGTISWAAFDQNFADASLIANSLCVR